VRAINQDELIPLAMHFMNVFVNLDSITDRTLYLSHPTRAEMELETYSGKFLSANLANTGDKPNKIISLQRLDFIGSFGLSRNAYRFCMRRHFCFPTFCWNCTFGYQMFWNHLWSPWHLTQGHTWYNGSRLSRKA
jgi:hypothetical protein